jgi:hypothetical protein
MSTEFLPEDLFVLLQQVMQELKETKELNKALHESLLSVLNDRKRSARPSGNLSDISSSSSGGTSMGSESVQSAKNKKAKLVQYSAIDSYHKELIENNARWKKKKNTELVKYLESPENIVAACEKKCPRLNQMR